MCENVTFLGKKVSSPSQIFNGTLSLQTRTCDGWLPCTKAGLSEGCGCGDVSFSAGLDDASV